MAAKKGIVLIAGGDWRYGKMARNLAMGIRLSSDIDITLFADEKASGRLNDFDRGLFKVEPLPQFAYQPAIGPASYYRVKTLLPDITSYSETVFLDVDMVWHRGRKADELFELDTDFSMTNEGYVDFATGENAVSKNYHFWSKPDDIKTAYASEKGIKTGKLYQYRSEFIYFKKNEKNKKYFALARKVYDHPKMHSIRFGDILPDEAAFSVASAIQHHYPHKNSWSPIYWDYLYAFMRIGERDKRGELFSRYYGSSMGGRLVRENQKVLYNELMKYYYQQYSIPEDYYWVDKIEFAPHHKVAIK